MRKSTRTTMSQQVMPDDHSELVPPLPIPNRTVKRLCANDSAATSVKVGYRQAVIPENPRQSPGGGFCFGRTEIENLDVINGGRGKEKVEDAKRDQVFTSSFL